MPLLRQVGISGAPLCKVQAAGRRAALGGGAGLQSGPGGRRGPLDVASHSLFPGSCSKPLEYLKAEQNKKHRDIKSLLHGEGVLY